MVNKSLGLIEVVGLAAALEAADAALKAANIELMGYELTKGGGLVLVKLCGDVGAVTAGVHAGSVAASKVSKVWSTHIIPRPHQQLSCIVAQDNAPEEKEPSSKQSVSPSQVIEEKQEPIATQVEETGDQDELPIEVQEEVILQLTKEPEMDKEQELETPSSESTNEKLADDDSIESLPEEKRAVDICNLCNDPACHRKKGDPKITCIYYGKNT